jgi:hypothetical protein
LESMWSNSWKISLKTYFGAMATFVGMITVAIAFLYLLLNFKI